MYIHNETAQRNVSLVPKLIQLDSVHNAAQVKNEMVSVVPGTCEKHCCLRHDDGVCLWNLLKWSIP